MLLCSIIVVLPSIHAPLAEPVRIRERQADVLLPVHEALRLFRVGFMQHAGPSRAAALRQDEAGSTAQEMTRITRALMPWSCAQIARCQPMCRVETYPFCNCNSGFPKSWPGYSCLNVSSCDSKRVRQRVLSPALKRVLRVALRLSRDPQAARKNQVHLEIRKARRPVATTILHLSSWCSSLLGW